jgi:hypothetical protein
MHNHYHLIASCSETYNLGYIMRLLQNRTAKRINSISGRVNHCYGGRYKAGIILEPNYYANAMKYLYQNPCKAGLTSKVEDWDFSDGSLFERKAGSVLPTSSHIFEKNLLIYEKDVMGWLNTNFNTNDYLKIKAASKRTVFRFPKSNSQKLGFL